jgi:hypothetical protein
VFSECETPTFGLMHLLQTKQANTQADIRHPAQWPVAFSRALAAYGRHFGQRVLSLWSAAHHTRAELEHNPERVLVVERAIERDNVGVRAVVTQHNNLCPVLFQVACMRRRRWVR